jgi:hypothetical protein
MPPSLVCDLPLFAVRKFPQIEKALTISGVDRFTRRGGTCRLHAIFMNQLCIIWGYQKELSSTAGHGEKNSTREYVVRSPSVSGPSGGQA